MKKKLFYHLGLDNENSIEISFDFINSDMEESDNMNGEERNDEFKIPNLFERFLMDDKNIKYKELIKELKKNLTKEMK